MGPIEVWWNLIRLHRHPCHRQRVPVLPLPTTIPTVVRTAAVVLIASRSWTIVDLTEHHGGVTHNAGTARTWTTGRVPTRRRANAGFRLLLVQATRIRLIAIDGVAGAGKSTVGALLALRLGWTFFDTGILFRVACHLALTHGRPPYGNDLLEAVLAQTERNLDIRNISRTDCDEGMETQVLLAGCDVTAELRREAVDQLLPVLSGLDPVRRSLTRAMRSMGRRLAEQSGAVVVGRDIGTTVFPEARLKFYLDADPDVRAHRRWLDLQARGLEVPLDHVRRDLLERDRLDSSRSNSPAAKAPEAVLVDTTRAGVDEVVAQLQAACQPLLCQNVPVP